MSALLNAGRRAHLGTLNLMLFTETSNGRAPLSAHFKVNSQAIRRALPPFKQDVNDERRSSSFATVQPNRGARKSGNARKIAAFGCAVTVRGGSALRRIPMTVIHQMINATLHNCLGKTAPQPLPIHRCVRFYATFKMLFARRILS